MSLPAVMDCQIHARAEINPSEDAQKVKQAISNILPDTTIHVSESYVDAESFDIQSLNHLCQLIRAMQSQGVYRRYLLRNMQGDSTWFYLNKQAAFVGKAAICEDTWESPLGPIVVTITSLDIDSVLDLLLSSAD